MDERKHTIMTDKEFKRLSRAQLIDVIYELQLKMDELTAENQRLQEALTDKRLRISQAGNLAQAVLEINDCYRSAQNAAEQYLAEIQAMRADTEDECKRILEDARIEAAKIVEAAKETIETCAPETGSPKDAQNGAPKQRVKKNEKQKKKSRVSSHKKTGRNRKKAVSKKKGV